ncbi:MAG: hypothetical protein J3Q66DRAFT_66054 [Benniella sp.]|nr:MAG: hypothetical protein J3Q66DRAFT_66054 [Benniella sp.]
MSPRPVRSAAKNVSYKPKSPKAVQRTNKRDSQDDDDEEEDTFGDETNLPDDDDSDEYVEPTKENGQDEDDDDDEEDNVDMDVDEDEENEPNSEEDSEPLPTRRRKVKVMNSFTVSLDHMNKLLNTRETLATAATAKEALKIRPATIPHKMATISNTKRGPRINRTKTHKRGEMHSSDLIPQSWRQAYQAPTSEDVSYASMQEDFLRKVVYPNMGSNARDFVVISSPSLDTTDDTHQIDQDATSAGLTDQPGPGRADVSALSILDDHLPILTTTKVHSRGENIEMPTMTAQYFETTNTTGVNDAYVLNAGFSVWALDWCPLPSFNGDEGGENKSYIAVGGFPDTAENCNARDQLYPLGKQDAHPNIIQIWTMNCKTNDEGELQGDPHASLDLCILHSYGAVFDLKWCPTGGYMEAGGAPGDLARLGILAGAFSDGSIRVFSIPDPDSLRKHIKKVDPMKATQETIYLLFSDPYASIRLGDVNFMSINWGTSERLAAGVTNGTVAVWDMKTMLSQSKETLAEKDSEFLDPIYLPQVHDVCVRSVDWLRNHDPAVIPWIIATSGYDGHVRYTDLHDMFTPIDIKTILGVPMKSICVPWAEGSVYVDIDLGAKLDQLYLESRGFRLFNAKGTIWDLSYSDYQPFLAAAISDGRVKISNPAYKARRGYGMIQNHIYRIQEMECEFDNGDGSAMQEQNESERQGHVQDEHKKTKTSILHYKEGEEKEYISKSDGFLDFYGANVAIQKVQWSRCYHSAAWLASGSAGGMVRIDNTMLRKEEGGSGNRIKYGPEPYVLKRRKANGKTFDEFGRRVGPDGQPVKIGRPRKPEAETTRGRKRLAAEARKAQAALKAATTPTPKRTSTRVKSNAKKKGMETEVPNIPPGTA